MNTVCLIPARGGSKRVPRKNLRLVGGRSLLQRAIDSAVGSGCFSDVVVSTDDEEVAAAALGFGATLDERPPAFSGDEIKFTEVLLDFLLRHSAKSWTTFAATFPTCPFRTSEDIAAAHQLLVKHPQAFVIGVSRFDFPPQLAMKCRDDILHLREPEAYATTTRSQNIGELHHPNGAFYGGSIARFLAEKTYFAAPMVGSILPPERSFDIDYPYQLKIACAYAETSGV